MSTEEKLIRGLANEDIDAQTYEEILASMPKTESLEFWRISTLILANQVLTFAAGGVNTPHTLGFVKIAAQRYRKLCDAAGVEIFNHF